MSEPSKNDEETNYDWLEPAEGWHVLHLFYQIDRTQWSMFGEDEQLSAKTELTRLIQEIRDTDTKCIDVAVLVL